jgi:hypothetical protein
MSTRALYTFGPDETGNAFNVYKHHDGYPSGAAAALKSAFSRAWELPRFEADEFAAAFVAANKYDNGGVRLMPSGDPLKVAHKKCADIEYRYQFSVIEGRPIVRAFEVNLWGKKPLENLIFEGSISDLGQFQGE